MSCAGDPSCIASCICKCVEPICKPILERSQNALSRRLGSFLFLEANYRKILNARPNLDAEAEKLGRHIEEQRRRRSLEVNEDLEKLQRDIKKLQGDLTEDDQNHRNLPAAGKGNYDQGKKTSTADEYASMSRCLCSCTPNLIQRYRLGMRVSQLLTNLEDFLTQATKENKAYDDSNREETGGFHRPLEKAVKKMSTTDAVGISAYLKDLQKHAEDERCKIIGVHGLGGVGKTTILQKFNDEFRKGTGGFQVVIYVVVSNDKVLNVEKIQRVISDRLDQLWDASQSPSERADSLKRVLSDRDFVLILDDVWQKFDLDAVGIPVPQEGVNSKLILASRDLQVCIDMGSQRNNLRVKPLEEEDSWTLFKSNLTAEAQTVVESDCAEPAEEIVKLCGGLPLALVVIGRAVASKSDYAGWDAARNMIKKSVGGYNSEVSESLLAKLEISYTLLEDEVKHCFSYCSLFPEDYSIGEERLVEYWIAESFIGKNMSLKDAYDKGIDNIQKLRAANLLERGDTESEVKTHDIIRDMAKWVACKRNKNSDFIVTTARTGQRSLQTYELRNWEVAKKISLMETPIEQLPDSPKCHELLTFFLQGNAKLKNLPKHFFAYMKKLRVLDLSSTPFKEFPIEEGMLPDLQYLNLSNTHIEMLPDALGSLSKLIWLNLSMTRFLTTVPEGVISGLSALLVLNMYCSNYGNWIAEDIGADAKGVRLSELEAMTELQTLGITVQSALVLDVLFNHNMLKESTKYLGLEFCKDLNPVSLSMFGRLRQLEKLSIQNCDQLRTFLLDDEVTHNSNEEKSDSMDRIGQDTGEIQVAKDVSVEASLEVLILASLPNLRHVLGGSQAIPYLKFLQELMIDKCPKLENVNWIRQLPRLAKLTISDCEKMEHFVEEKGKVPSAFSKLQVISLKYLPRLKMICCPQKFPSLKTIRVHECPMLKRLPFGLDYKPEKIQKISGQTTWWNELEWEGDRNTILGRRNIFARID